jgi:TetR/AcrR family transcriptional regulator
VAGSVKALSLSEQFRRSGNGLVNCENDQAGPPVSPFQLFASCDPAHYYDVPPVRWAVSIMPYETCCHKVRDELLQPVNAVNRARTAKARIMHKNVGTTGQSSSSPKSLRRKKAEKTVNIVDDNASTPRESARDRILKAALECFAEFGFAGAVTRMIAQRAKVTHPLVLYHFETKEKLWVESVGGALDAYLEFVRVEIPDNPATPAKEALAKFIEYFVRFMAKAPDIHRIMSMESRDSPRIHWLVDGYLREYFTKIRDIIKRGQLEGSVRDGDPSRLFYQIIGSTTIFTTPIEYELLTGRNVFSDSEIHYTIALIFDTIFVNKP